MSPSTSTAARSRTPTITSIEQGRQLAGDLLTSLSRLQDARSKATSGELPEAEATELTETVLTLRHLARTDLWFLLAIILGRPDAYHPWLLERCIEVQSDPDGRLDLWAREHYKSTIITYALSIQDIIASHGVDKEPGPEATICIFSHSRPAAKKFLRQIKLELEGNTLLQDLFPDVLYRCRRRRRRSGPRTTGSSSSARATRRRRRSRPGA